MSESDLVQFSHSYLRTRPHTRVATPDWAMLKALDARRPDALECIYNEHCRTVFGICRRVTGLDCQAEEITQEVFLQLWRDPSRVDLSRGSLATFLRTVAHRRAVDFVRKEAARIRRERFSYESVHEERIDDQVVNGDAAIRTAATTSDALGRLPDCQRQAIELAFFGGYTYRQTAAILGIPEGTVKTRIRLGLLSLAATLSQVRESRSTSSLPSTLCA